MTTTYDPDNIFAKILRGEAPCAKIFEDDVSLAFLDVMPRADGHTLVIPKVAARNLLDVAPADLARFMPSVRTVAIAVKAGMKAEGLTLQQFNEFSGGQQVFHLHFHVLPRWTGVALRPPGGPFQNAEALRPHAGRIIAALPQMGPALSDPQFFRPGRWILKPSSRDKEKRGGTWHRLAIDLRGNGWLFRAQLGRDRGAAVPPFRISMTQANAAAVNQAWKKAGMKGSMSNSLVSNIGFKLGLAGNLPKGPKPARRPLRRSRHNRSGKAPSGQPGAGAVGWRPGSTA